MKFYWKKISKISFISEKKYGLTPWKKIKEVKVEDKMGCTQWFSVADLENGYINSPGSLLIDGTY